MEHLVYQIEQNPSCKNHNFNQYTSNFCLLSNSNLIFERLSIKGLAGSSKPLYEVCDYKSEKSAPMFCIEWTPLHL